MKCALLCNGFPEESHDKEQLQEMFDYLGCACCIVSQSRVVLSARSNLPRPIKLKIYIDNIIQPFQTLSTMNLLKISLQLKMIRVCTSLNLLVLYLMPPTLTFIMRFCRLQTYLLVLTAFSASSCAALLRLLPSSSSSR
jgi:hypothetical protein